MKQRKFNLLNLVLLTLVTSCTTQFKKAQNLISDRNYDEALIIMDQLIAKDPNDSDYQVGLKQAREGVIDQSLIRVRMFRLANNNQESLELLRKTIEQENSWGVFPSGAVAFTQDEETKEAFKSLHAEISNLKFRHRNLRVLYLIERYKTLFDEKHRKTFDPAYSDAKIYAQKFCLEKSRTTSEKTFFYNQLISKWCNYTQQKSLIAKADSVLYKDVNLSIKNELSNQLPESFVIALKNELNKQFTKTGWYDTKSKNELVLVGQGDYRFTENNYNEYRIHSYSEPITIKNSDGSTKTSYENKNFPYYATVIIQNIKAHLKISSTNLDIASFETQFNQTEKETSHSIYNSAIGLRPEKVGKSFSQSEWLSLTTSHLVSDINDHLKTSFEKTYCTTLADTQKRIELINQSLICLRQIKNRPLDIINRVFTDEYQMTSLEMETLFKVVD